MTLAAASPQLAAYLVCLGAPVGTRSGYSRRNLARQLQAALQPQPGDRCRRPGRGSQWPDLRALDVARGIFPVDCRFGRHPVAGHQSHAPVLCRLHDRGNLRSALPTRCSRLRLLHGLGTGLYRLLVVRRAAHTLSSGTADAIELVHGCGDSVCSEHSWVTSFTDSFLAWSMRRLIARGYDCSLNPIHSTGSRMVQDSASSARFSGELWQASLEGSSPAPSCSLHMCCQVLPA